MIFDNINRFVLENSEHVHLFIKLWNGEEYFEE